LLISLKYVVTEFVLFLIVVFKTLDILQGSIATYLWCGGIFSDIIITSFLLILIVKIGRQMQNDMPVTMHRSKSKPEIKFQYGGRPFFKTGSSFISAVD